MYGTSSFDSEGECEGARAISGAASSLELISFSFSKTSVLGRVSFFISDKFLSLGSSLLNHFDLFFIFSNFLEEVLFNG